MSKNVLEYEGRQYILLKSEIWWHGFDVSVGDNNSQVFKDSGFTIVGEPETSYDVSVSTDTTDMPLELAAALVKLAYPDFRPQFWDQVTNIDSLVLRYDFKMYNSNNECVSLEWRY